MFTSRAITMKTWGECIDDGLVYQETNYTRTASMWVKWTQWRHIVYHSSDMYIYIYIFIITTIITIIIDYYYV